MSRLEPSLRSRLVLTASILLPFLYILFYIWNTAADVPLRDDLYLIKGAVVERFCAGTLTFADLWRAAARTRLLGYNLLLVANTAWFGLNSKLVPLLIPFVLLTSALLIYRDYHRSLRDSCSPVFIAATYALPMLLLFSIAQWESLGFSFGIIFVWSVPWFLASFYAVEDFLLRGRGISWLGATLIPAAAILVFGQTASFAFGVAVVATMVVYLAINHRKLPQGFALRAAGVGAVLALLAFLYFFRITANDYFPGSRNLDWSAFAHPWNALTFILASLAASVTGVGVAKPHLDFQTIVGLGLVVASVYALALVVYFRVRMHERTYLPFFLLAYALAFVAFMTIGRFPFGPAYGMASRYTSNTLYGLVAIVWIAVFALSKAGSIKGFPRITLWAALVLLFAGQAWTSVAEWQTQPGRKRSFEHLRTVALNLESASYRDLAAFEERPFLSRAALRVLRRHRLNVYRSLPPPPPQPPPASTVTLSLPAGGATSVTTVSDSEDVQVGYASLESEAAGVPFGTAVIRFVESENMVTEAVLQPVTPTTQVRLFVEHFRTPASRRIDSHTAIAIVNRWDTPVQLTFRLRDLEGATIATGHRAVAPRAHISGFVSALAEIAPDFRVPADTGTGAGTLEIAGDNPIAVAALRFTYNVKNEALITAIPVADLRNASSETRRYIPYFIDGGGYATELMLLNTTDLHETGTLRILDRSGNSLPVTGIPEPGYSELRYSIAPHGVFQFQSGASAPTPRAGWVQIVPDRKTSVPFGMGLFSFAQGGELLSLSSIPATSPTTHARIHVDKTSWHDTGLAIGNPSGSAANVDLKVFRVSGSAHPTGSDGLSLALAPNGHFAGFAGEYMPEVPVGFIGVLDITSTVPFVPLTMRSLLTFRNYQHWTVFPAADLTREASTAALFPHLADGGAYTTDLFFGSPGPPLTARLRFIGPTGAPLAIASQDTALTTR